MYIYMNERTLNRPKDLEKKLRYTQSIEIDEKKLCEMKDKLLQEELAVARLNPSNVVNKRVLYMFCPTRDLYSVSVPRTKLILRLE